MDLPRPLGARYSLGRAWTYGTVWIASNEPFVIGWYRFAERKCDNGPGNLGLARGNADAAGLLDI